jgi:hypothetical protein
LERENIYNLDMSVRWLGKIEKQGGEVLILFFLNGLFLEGKCILLLNFFCYLGVYLRLCLRSKVNLGFHKYADGGPIMDVRVR